MHYQTVFDLAQAGYKSWWFGTSGLLFLVVAILFLRYQRIQAALNSSSLLGASPLVGNTAIPKFAIVFAAGWTLIAFGATYPEYRSAREALDTGRYSVVEGQVTDFVPMRYTGHSMERFTVGGQTFKYSDFDVTAGFNNTQSHGGPIKLGEFVRVAYIGNVIIRLEVGQP